MSSLTKKTEMIRTRRDRSSGKERKRALRRNGSTPVFPIHPEKAADSEKAAQS